MAALLIKQKNKSVIDSLDFTEGIIHHVMSFICQVISVEIFGLRVCVCVCTGFV